MLDDDGVAGRERFWHASIHGDSEEDWRGTELLAAPGDAVLEPSEPINGRFVHGNPHRIGLPGGEAGHFATVDRHFEDPTVRCRPVDVRRIDGNGGRLEGPHWIQMGSACCECSLVT